MAHVYVPPWYNRFEGSETMRIGYAVAIISVLVLAEVGCEGSAVNTPGELPGTPPGDLSLSRVDRGADVGGYLDQYCEGEGPAWTTILPARRTGQSFTPSSPSKHDCGCNFLVGVEVALTHASNQGPDSLTLYVIDFPGDTLTMVTDYVKRGFEGWFHFDLPGGGIRVPAGERLLLRLHDSPRMAFGWRYVGGNCYPGGDQYEGDCGDHVFGGDYCRSGKDFLFRTYCDYPPEVYNLRELTAQTAALVTHKGAASSLKAKLDNVRGALEDCDRKPVVAKQALGAYIHELDALPPSIVDPLDADFLVESAHLILELIQEDATGRVWPPGVNPDVSE